MAHLHENLISALPLLLYAWAVLVKLSDLKLKQVRPDADDTIDCENCGTPVGTFDEVYVSKDDETYKICQKCGEIYKIKD